MKRLLVELTGAPAEVRVSGARFHYLAHVLRAEEGEALEVFDGRGRAFDARVLKLEGDAATLTLGAPREGAKSREWLLLQGLPKADKLELILQKTTELGVTQVLPLAMERSVVKLTADKAADRVLRWKKIVEEAARQCRRSDVPAIAPVRKLPEALATLPEGTLLLVLDEEENAVRLGEAFLTHAADARPVALVIGPEGGIAREELHLLRSAGALPVSLGARILRTETAGVAALAVLQHLDGAFG